MKSSYLLKNLIFSSEHYTNNIPTRLKKLFQNQKEILTTHRAWDLGSHCIIDHLEKSFGEIIFKAEVSRLLVDLNRSLGHKNLYSEFTKTLPKPERLALLDEYYFPYRESFEKTINEMKNKSRHPIIHIAIHSFTPRWEGVLRNADIGLLYDPSHSLERDFCLKWKEKINYLFPKYKVRSNYPYHGRSNSFPTELRRKYKNNYLGIELEINQAFFSKDGSRLLDKPLANCIIESLQEILIE